jgi:hypothetical protein
VPKTIVVAIVKAITVARFATSHPIVTGLNGTPKGPLGRAPYAGAIETTLWAGRAKAATRTAKIPANVGCTAACEAAATAKAAVTAATAKPAAVTAAAAAVTAPTTTATTGKTISDSKSCEENSDRSRSY